MVRGPAVTPDDMIDARTGSLALSAATLPTEADSLEDRTQIRRFRRLHLQDPERDHSSHDAPLPNDP